MISLGVFQVELGHQVLVHLLLFFGIRLLLGLLKVGPGLVVTLLEFCLRHCVVVPRHQVDQLQAFLRVLVQQVFYQLLSHGRYRLVLGELYGRLSNQFHQRALVRCVERQCPEDHRVQHDSNGPAINSRCCGRGGLLEALGRHI